MAPQIKLRIAWLIIFVSRLVLSSTGLVISCEDQYTSMGSTRLLRTRSRADAILAVVILWFVQAGLAEHCRPAWRVFSYVAYCIRYRASLPEARKFQHSQLVSIHHFCDSGLMILWPILHELIQCATALCLRTTSSAAAAAYYDDRQLGVELTYLVQWITHIWLHCWPTIWIIPRKSHCALTDADRGTRSPSRV